MRRSGNGHDTDTKHGMESRMTTPHTCKVKSYDSSFTLADFIRLECKRKCKGKGVGGVGAGGGSWGEDAGVGEGVVGVGGLAGVAGSTSYFFPHQSPVTPYAALRGITQRRVLSHILQRILPHYCHTIRCLYTRSASWFVCSPRRGVAWMGPAHRAVSRPV